MAITFIYVVSRQPAMCMQFSNFISNFVYIYIYFILNFNAGVVMEFI